MPWWVTRRLCYFPSTFQGTNRALPQTVSPDSAISLCQGKHPGSPAPDTLLGPGFEAGLHTAITQTTDNRPAMLSMRVGETFTGVGRVGVVCFQRILGHAFTILTTFAIQSEGRDGDFWRVLSGYLGWLQGRGRQLGWHPSVGPSFGCLQPVLLGTPTLHCSLSRPECGPCMGSPKRPVDMTSTVNFRLSPHR